MANETITELPTVFNSTLSDVIYAVQSNISVQETLQQVFNLMLSQTILNFAGNPNSNLAGKIYQFCWDTTHNVLWVCTTTGSTSTAVWKLAFGNNLLNGQTFIGSAGNIPVNANLTAGSNISITNGAGSITIAATGGANFTWSTITGTSATMSPYNGYFANNAGLVTLTLPTTAALGSSIKVYGQGAGGWKIAQNSGQQIILGASSTTVGTGGSLASTIQYNNVEITCMVANTVWQCAAPEGSLTVV